MTESNRRHHVVYFRHDDWKTLCAPLIEHLTEQTFKKISDVSIPHLVSSRLLSLTPLQLARRSRDPEPTEARVLIRAASAERGRCSAHCESQEGSKGRERTSRFNQPDPTGDFRGIDLREGTVPVLKIDSVTEYLV